MRKNTSNVPNEANDAKAAADLARSVLPSKLGPKLGADKDDLTMAFLNNYEIQRLQKHKSISEKYYQPCTTSQEYGWQWIKPAQLPERFVYETIGDDGEARDGPYTDPINVPLQKTSFYTLERFPSNARKCRDVFKWFGGSIDSIA